MGNRIALLLLATTLIAVPTFARSGASPTVIRIYMRPDICAGVCPNVDITVRPDGNVISLPTWLDRKNGRRPPEQFIIRRGKLATFYSLMESVRPSGERLLRSGCYFFPGQPRQPDTVDVRWGKGRHSDHLAGCPLPGTLTRTVERAITTIGIDPYSGLTLRDRRREERYFKTLPVIWH